QKFVTNVYVELNAKVTGFLLSILHVGV
ncbi:hypothetical protein A2U01_0025732, partial [Trifolium medium]|nr:hypothetical protein [Trifolium medium]